MEQKATVAEFKEALFTLLRENLVGIAEKAEGDTLVFTLVNGQKFFVSVSKLG